MIGCSRKTVSRIAQEVKPDVHDADEKLAAHQRLLHQHLSIEQRVEPYDKIAQKVDSNPFAAMRALELIDEDLCLHIFGIYNAAVILFLGDEFMPR